MAKFILAVGTPRRFGRKRVEDGPAEEKQPELYAPPIAVYGCQFGPMRMRRASSVAQGAALRYLLSQVWPAPIFTRSLVHSGERALAINA